MDFCPARHLESLWDFAANFKGRKVIVCYVGYRSYFVTPVL